MSALLLALTIAACGGGSPDASPTTTTVGSATSSTGESSTSTSSTVETTTTSGPTTTSGSTSPTSEGATPEEQEVIDRYVGYWNARTAANTGTPNPADPALAEFATGAQLDAVIAETQANLDGGLAFRPAAAPANFRTVRVISMDAGVAVVQECVVDDGLVIRRDTGEVVNDTVTTQSVRGELTQVEGRWRVSGAEVIQFWQGVDGCANDA